MRKSTILMLSIVFVASVLIVGIFGMKVFTIGKINYVKELVVNSESFSVDKTDATTNFKVDDGKYSYLVLAKSGEPINLTITPTLIPTLTDVELTNPEISIHFNHNNPEKSQTTFLDGVFTISGNDTFTVTLQTNDGSNLHVRVQVVVIFI